MEKEKDTRMNVKLNKRTHQKLKYCSKVLGMKISDFLNELIDETWCLLAGFKSVDSLEYERSVLSNCLSIRAYGKKRFFSGSIAMPEDATDEQIFKAIHNKHIKGELE